MVNDRATGNPGSANGAQKKQQWIKQMQTLNQVVICPSCGKLAHTEGKRTFTGFLKCECRACKEPFLYPLSGLFIFIYTMLVILQGATLYFVISDFALREGDISKAMFAGVVPTVLLAGALYANIFNYKLVKRNKG